MNRIALDILKPGMVLANDVKADNGRRLLGRGTTIEPKHLRIFKIWGIMEVDIQGATSENVETASDEQLDQDLILAVQKKLIDRFHNNDLEHPVVHSLFRQCVLREVRRIQSGETTLEEISCPVPPRLADDDSMPHVCRDVSDDILLPTLPDVFADIIEVFNDPRSSAHHVAEVISRDTSLSAKLLKIVNSSFYGFPSSIDTISRAVTIIGSKQISLLALGTCVMSIFADIPAHVLDVRNFWMHSLACGVASRALANMKNVQHSERFFVAGLLHDIGRLVLIRCEPLRVQAALGEACRNGITMRQAEQQTLGCSHDVVGARLIRKWNLPDGFELAARHHHVPDTGLRDLEPHIVHVTDLCTIALGIGFSGEYYVPRLSESAWETLCLSPAIFPSLIKQTEVQLQIFAEVI